MSAICSFNCCCGDKSERCCRDRFCLHQQVVQQSMSVCSALRVIIFLYGKMGAVWQCSFVGTKLFAATLMFISYFDLSWKNFIVVQTLNGVAMF
jgi:hypothetical protein